MNKNYFKKHNRKYMIVRTTKKCNRKNMKLRNKNIRKDVKNEIVEGVNQGLVKYYSHLTYIIVMFLVIILASFMIHLFQSAEISAVANNVLQFLSQFK